MKEVAEHDLHTDEPPDPKWDIDEVDAETLLGEAHYTITRMLSIRQPQWVRNEAAVLLKQLDDALRWHRWH